MDLPPDEELTREVYARFGVAYYMTECVHRGLVNVFSMLPFGPQEASRPRIHERMKVAEQKTLGELVTMAKPILATALHPSLDWALATRNFFAHGFWYERIHMMSNAAGKEQLVAELSQAADSLQELNRVLDDLTFAHLRQIGATEDQMAEAMRSGASEAVEPMPARRVPRSEEAIEIVSAWVIQDNERSSLILRDLAGEMWQLCDVGLGWSYHSEPAPEWVPFQKLNELLPAKIIARAKSATMWNFKLHVSTGALICVEMNESTKIFTWRVERVDRDRP
jgi:hypothetical protein